MLWHYVKLNDLGWFSRKNVRLSFCWALYSSINIRGDIFSSMQMNFSSISLIPSPMVSECKHLPAHETQYGLQR